MGTGARSSNLAERTAVLILVMIGLAVYANGLSGAFVLDDLSFVNEAVLGGTSWNWLVAETESPIKGRPLVGLTFVLNYALGGEDVAGYHLVNIAVHLACAVVLFGVIRQTLIRFPQTAVPGLSSTGFAFACTLLWMIHPLQTECVNYLSQRTESIASFFILVALYCAIRASDAPSNTRWIVRAAVASWAAAFCKEIAGVGPILIVLLDLSLGGERVGQVLRRRWQLYAAVFSSWLPVAALMCLLPRTSTVGTTAEVTVWQYASNQFVMIVEYLKLSVWPSTLLIDYGRPWQASWLEVLPAAVAVLSLLALVLAVYRRRPEVGFLGLAVFLLLAPTSSIIPVNTEVGAERRMYLPLAAVSILAVAALCRAIDHCCNWIARSQLSTRYGVLGTGRSSLISHRSALMTLLTLIAIPLAIRTFIRNDDYRSPVRIWTQAVHARPANHRAWGNLALAWQEFDRPTANQVFKEIIRRWPDDTIAHFEVASQHRANGNFREAIHCYRRTVELEPSHAEARRRLVWLLAACDDDRLRDGDEAMRIATALVDEYPQQVMCHDALAAAQAETGDFEAATKTMRAAIDLARNQNTNTFGLHRRLWLYERRREPCRFGARGPFKSA